MAVRPLQSIGIVYLLGILAVLSVTFIPKFLNSFIRESGGSSLSFMQINAIQFSLIGLILFFVVLSLTGVISND